MINYVLFKLIKMQQIGEDILNIIFNNCKNVNFLCVNKANYELMNDTQNKIIIKDIKNKYFHKVFSQVFCYNNSIDIHSVGLIKYSHKLPLDKLSFIQFINDYDTTNKLFNETLMYYTTMYGRIIALTVNTIVNNLLKTNHPHLFLSKFNLLKI